MGTTKKHWSYSTGERGRNRVRAYEDNRTGILTLLWYEDGSRKTRSLGHEDREQAKRQADDLAAKLGEHRDNAPPIPGDAPLRLLFDIYGREVTPQKGERQQKHDRTCMEMFQRFFGAERKAKSLNRRDWDAFIKERGAGRIRPKHKKKAKRVGPRTVARDLLTLRAILNWATTAGDGRGNYLLQRNPLKGFPIPREENPSRPTLTRERYEAMLAVAEDVGWRFHVALVLARETGHRIKAIRHLQWRDVDLERGWIYWRAEADKIGHEHGTPLSPEAVEALKKAREEKPGIGEAWVLPSPRYPNRPVSRTHMRKWWLQAEEDAELDHVHGLGWHGLRRMFATELKHTPLRDLQELGGWKTHRTILECYQRPDEETMRKALESRRRVSAGT